MQGLIINSKVYEAVPLSGKEARCRDCALLDFCDHEEYESICNAFFKIVGTHYFKYNKEISKQLTKTYQK